jgi:hypothetical protein
MSDLYQAALNMYPIEMGMPFAPKPATRAPRQRDEERLSRMLVHHIRQATTGGAERRY